MEKLVKQHTISFQHAIEGIIWAVKSQPNFRVHLLFSFIAVLLGVYVSLSQLEWVILVFTIFWGLSAEMINTAIEAVCDLISTQWHKEIKIAKDVSAGMMLTVAAGAVVVATFLLVPKLMEKLLW